MKLRWVFPALYGVGWLIVAFYAAVFLFDPGLSYFSHYSSTNTRVLFFCHLLYLIAPTLRVEDRWHAIAISSVPIAFFQFDALAQQIIWAIFGDPLWGTFPFEPIYLIFIPILLLEVFICLAAWRRRWSGEGWIARSVPLGE